MQTKFKQLLLLLLIWALVPWLGVAQSKDSSAAPPLLLANELGPNVDPAKYLISEKYDGVRAIWDGKMLRFRSGRTVNAPAWFVAKLPAQALDGELWLARGRFEALSGIVRKAEPQDDEWQQIKYMILSCRTHLELSRTACSASRKSSRRRSGRSWLRWSNFAWLIVSHSNGSWMKSCVAAAKG